MGSDKVASVILSPKQVVYIQCLDFFVSLLHDFSRIPGITQAFHHVFFYFILHTVKSILFGVYMFEQLHVDMVVTSLLICANSQTPNKIFKIQNSPFQNTLFCSFLFPLAVFIFSRMPYQWNSMWPYQFGFFHLPQCI